MINLKKNYQYSAVQLHFETIKQLKKGHPWVLKDRFTEKFPNGSYFLLANLETQNSKNLKNPKNHKLNKNDFALILHDPTHPQIKGRLWEYPVVSFDLPVIKGEGILNSTLFWNLFKSRVEESILKRQKFSFFREERENFYLLFGEADFIPGMNLLHLKNRVFIQIYHTIWLHLINRWLPLVKEILNSFFPKDYFQIIIIQDRTLKLKKKGEFSNLHQNYHPKFYSYKTLEETDEIPFTLHEYGIHYQIDFSKSPDGGLYTDMATIRKSLLSLMRRSSAVLNLYAHTGAFSLLALKEGVKKVVSVDLSSKYLEILSNNLQLNNQRISSSVDHFSIQKSVSLYFKQQLNSESLFDFIICDPPSSSTDGATKSSALTNYQELLPSIIPHLAQNGFILLFLNTHSVSFASFKRRMEVISANLQNHPIVKRTINERSFSLIKFKITESFFLGAEDCPTLPSFPEGNYIKGLLLKIIFS